MDKSVKKMRHMDESRRQTTPGRAFMNNWQKARRSYESQIERWKTSSVCPVWRSSQNWKTRKMQIILSSDRCPGAFYWENARQRYTPVRRFPMSSIVFICVRRAFDISWIMELRISGLLTKWFAIPRSLSSVGLESTEAKLYLLPTVIVDKFKVASLYSFWWCMRARMSSYERQDGPRLVSKEDGARCRVVQPAT